MPIITATAAKAASNVTVLRVNPVAGSLTETLINDAITEATERPGTDDRIYKVILSLDVDFKGGISQIEIIQSDDSRILLSELIRALKLANHQVVYNERKAVNKVNLSLFWGF